MTDTQEPVAWQRRLRHVNDDRAWTEWKDCSKEQADFAAANGRPEHFREWLFAEVRPLYTQDQLDAAVRAERERCAKISDRHAELEPTPEEFDADIGAIVAAKTIAAAIREGE